MGGPKSYVALFRFHFLPEQCDPRSCVEDLIHGSELRARDGQPEFSLRRPMNKGCPLPVLKVLRPDER